MSFSIIFWLHSLIDFTLKFVTNPSLRNSKNANETIVSGCSYSSSTHSSWTGNSFIQRNDDDLISISNATQVTSETRAENVFTLPSVKLPYIESGHFRCVITVDDKMFYSKASKLYGSPGNFCLKLLISMTKVGFTLLLEFLEISNNVFHSPVYWQLCYIVDFLRIRIYIGLPQNVFFVLMHTLHRKTTW